MSVPNRLAPEVAARVAKIPALRTSVPNSVIISGYRPFSTRKMTITPPRPNVIAVAEPKMMAFRTAKGLIPVLARYAPARYAPYGARVLDRSAASL